VRSKESAVSVTWNSVREEARLSSRGGGRGSGNAALAKKLGADAYIDSAATDPAAELQKRAERVDSATAPSGKAMSALIGGLGVNGTMVVVGASLIQSKCAQSVAFRQKRHQGLGRRHPHRLAGHPTVRGMTVWPMIESTASQGR